MKALALALLMLCASAQAQTISTIRVASGLHKPSWVGVPPDGTNRLFVCEQKQGTIVKIVNGTQGPTMLNVSALLHCCGGERGLLGMAFHPDFANNGFIYVTYTDVVGAAMLVRYHVIGDVADPATATTIVGPVAHPLDNHNGGCLQFGPLDGKLYYGMGDGGGADNPSNSAQTIGSFFGKIHRLDVDAPWPHHSPGNPFPSNPTAWHYGLRNPWQFSFDIGDPNAVGRGDLYIADTGQDAVEEVDYVPAGVSGLNFGWRCLEGTTCTGLSCGTPCGSTSFTPPVETYPHVAGAPCSGAAIGGYVYRGRELPSLKGEYFYADFCRLSPAATSRIFSFKMTGGVKGPTTDRTVQLAPAGGLVITQVSCFGKTADDELLIADHFDGEVYLMVNPSVHASTLK